MNIAQFATAACCYRSAQSAPLILVWPRVPVVTSVACAYSSPVNRHRQRRVLHVSTRLVLGACALAGIQVASAATADADPAAIDWHRLRVCESGDQYDIDTGNGYYGAYQFDLPTWHSVGGDGQPNLNPAPEQDYRALYLYRMRGWQPWGCATLLNFREDPDARTRRIPTRHESTYIGDPPDTTTSGGHHPGTPAASSADTPPPWPGVPWRGTRL